jgi:uncharacterized protein (TIGR00369 family)
MAAPLAHQINEGLGGFERLYGLQLVELSDTEARARVSVRAELKQGYGLVHGGVYSSIAESLASLATAVAVAERRCLAVGMANNSSFFRPITKGTVHALAKRLHAGRTTWVWDVACRDDDERLCAITRVTLAVRPQREQ